VKQNGIVLDAAWAGERKSYVSYPHSLQILTTGLLAIDCLLGSVLTRVNGNEVVASTPPRPPCSAYMLTIDFC